MCVHVAEMLARQRDGRLSVSNRTNYWLLLNGNHTFVQERTVLQAPQAAVDLSGADAGEEV